MNTELAYYAILQKNQLVIFLIKSVFCEHAKQKKMEQLRIVKAIAQRI